MTKKILLYDDDPDIAEVLKLILLKRDWEVIHHSGLKLSSEKVERLQPSIILIDCFYSTEEIKIFIATIKKNPETKDIPVILFTAMSNIAELTLSTQADGYIRKPFSNAELIEMINLLAGTRASDQLFEESSR